MINRQYKKNVCNNCGIYGHLFYKCKKPIMSFGIICYRHDPLSHEIQYLMIRRKDSLGYVDFMRGKYPIFNKRYLLNIIEEMTNYEKEKVNLPLVSRKYKIDVSKDLLNKLDSVDLPYLIN